MEFELRQGDIAALDTACLVIGVIKDAPPGKSAAAIDLAADGTVQRLIESGDIDSNLGKTTMLHNLPGLSAARLLLVGCGKAEDFTASKFCNVCTAAGSYLRQHAVSEATSCLHELELPEQDEGWRLQHSVVSLDHANYVYTTTKPQKNDTPSPLKKLALFADQSYQEAVTRGAAIAAGYATARQLGNLPANICNPAYLAQHARDFADKHEQCKASILDRAEMADLGMDALLGVAQGSDFDPKLIVLEYQGADNDQQPVVLVGKGITFDTGGISLKPGEHMDQMKYDMCGAASVLGAFETSARLQLPINLVSVVAAVENMPDGAAYRPGDVLTSMSGQTIEVLNTDAEGRMILCDALTYCKRFEPDTIIDVATLTGACVIALGHHASAVMSHHDELAGELLVAGQQAVDRAWRMPLWDDYQEQLDTPFADMKNVGGKSAGAVTAGCFLSRFTKDMNWAHLDIAGSAWKWGTQEGATGRPVGLLSQFLINRAQR